jgi:SAM-dependent methyltransferase
VEQYKYLKRTNCPSCGLKKQDPYLIAPDFRFSHRDFPLVTCSSCGLIYTALVPASEDIGAFYKADSYDSHRIDNRSLISRVYRLVRKWNVRNKIKLVRSFTSKGLVVDYGCGLGHLVAEMENKGMNVRGFEIDEDVRKLSSDILNIEVKSLSDFSTLNDSSVDVLMMWHVLEHVYDLRDDFQQIVDKVKKKGVFLIAVPNCRAYDAQFYKKHWEAYDVPRHLYHFDKESIDVFTSSYGLTRESIIPMRFDSYYVSMRSEKNIKGGGFIPRGVWKGFLSNLLAYKYGYSSHIYVYRKK